MKISQDTIDCVRRVSEQNEREYREQQAASESNFIQGGNVSSEPPVGNKKLALLMALAVQVDERGLDAAIASLVVSARFPKEACNGSR